MESSGNGNNVHKFGLSLDRARKIIREAAEGVRGTVVLSYHAENESMIDLNIQFNEVVRVLRRGRVSEPEYDAEYGDWVSQVSGRVAGRLLRVVVGIYVSPPSVVVITAIVIGGPKK